MTTSTPQIQEKCGEKWVFLLFLKYMNKVHLYIPVPRHTDQPTHALTCF